MKILITGACGFIGGHFLDKILEDSNYEVSVIDKITYAANSDNLKKIFTKNIPFFPFGIEETKKVNEIIKNLNIDVILNFAAETHVDNSIKDLRPFIASNINGVYSLLESCRTFGTKLIHISTDEVYGPANWDPFKEDDKLNPLNPYSATKAASEHLILSYCNTFKIDYLIVRPSNNYGPRQNKEKFIPKYINCLKENKKFPLYGDGLQVREWFFVKDCADSIKRLLPPSRTLNNVYNIGCPRSKQFNIDVLKIIHSFYNPNNTAFENTIEFVEDRKGHDKKYAINIERFFKEFKNLNSTPLEEGLKQTIDYYK